MQYVDKTIYEITIVYSSGIGPTMMVLAVIAALWKQQ